MARLSNRSGSTIFGCHIRHYRVWIYSFNIILIILSIVFVFVAHAVLQQERLLVLFPLSYSTDFTLLYIYVGPSCQFLICLLGILATIANRPVALQAFWYLTAVSVAFDVGVGLAWVPRFKVFHRTLPTHLRTLIRDYQTNVRFCGIWNKVQSELNCCGVQSYIDWFELSRFCEEPLLAGHRLPHSCCRINSSNSDKYCNTTILESKWPPIDSSDNTISSSATGGDNGMADDDIGCSEPLLKWLHIQADILFIVGYCVLFLIKIISLVILRREVRELLAEIFHERDKRCGRRRSSDIGFFVGDAADKDTDNVVVVGIEEPKQLLTDKDNGDDNSIDVRIAIGEIKNGRHHDDDNDNQQNAEAKLLGKSSELKLDRSETDK